MKALDNLYSALKDAGGRRKAFKMQPIKLTDRQKEILKECKKGYNKGILLDIEAYDIIRGRNTPINAIKVVWRLTPTTGMMHYYTHEEFRNILNL